MPEIVLPGAPPRDGQDGSAEPSPPEQISAAKADRIVATVNGKPIHESELVAGLPLDGFESFVQQVREAKIERLIQTEMIRQFLQSQGIEVAQEAIDAEVQRMRQTPPAAGCSCCRYESLEQFMALNGFTMPELRNAVRSDLGFAQYLEGQWQKAHPTEEDRAAFVQGERERVDKEYMNASHIFVNVFQAKGLEADPERVWKEAADKAKVAWTRLENGEPFAEVAKDVSEDMMSAPKGGELGCVSRDVFGEEFRKAVESLHAGAYGQPFASPWGYHVARRGTVSDQDVLAILTDEFHQDCAQKTFERIHEAATIVRADDQERGPAEGDNDPSGGGEP